MPPGRHRRLALVRLGIEVTTREELLVRRQSDATQFVMRFCVQQFGRLMEQPSSNGLGDRWLR
jgi:hypothetical protein